MKKVKLKSSIWFDFFAIIAIIIIDAIFPELPPYITMLPTFLVISLSLIIYFVRKYFYNKHIVIINQLQNNLNSLEDKARLDDVKLSKYDNLFNKIISEFFECSISASDQIEKNVLTKLHDYVDNAYTRLLIETERKRTDIHENSEDN